MKSVKQEQFCEKERIHLMKSTLMFGDMSHNPKYFVKTIRQGH